MYSYHVLKPSESAAYTQMTFPSYRSLLGSIGRDGSIIALGASLLDRPVGLVLAQIQPDGRTAIVHSIYVGPEHRGQGVATALLTQMERALDEHGVVRVHAVYMTGKPSTPGLERVLQKCDWTPPQTEALRAKLSADALKTVPWLTWDRLSPGFCIFPWHDLTDDDRDSIARRQEAEAWMPPELIPFRYDRDFEPQTSLGLRYQGQVAGWMVNHALDSSTLRMTSAWVRKDLQRVGRCIPLCALAAASSKRGVEAGFQYFIWMAYLHQKGMAAFTQRWVAPYSVAFSESRKTEKRLSGKPAYEEGKTEGCETLITSLR